MAADVSLVYLSTASTILYFSSCSSSFYSFSAARPPSLLSFLLHPSSSNALVALFAYLPIPSFHGRVSHRADVVHLFVTASLALPQEKRAGGLSNIRESIPDTCCEKKSRSKSIQNSWSSLLVIWEVKAQGERRIRSGRDICGISSSIIGSFSAGFEDITKR